MTQVLLNLDTDGKQTSIQVSSEENMALADIMTAFCALLTSAGYSESAISEALSEYATGKNKTKMKPLNS